MSVAFLPRFKHQSEKGEKEGVVGKTGHRRAKHPSLYTLAQPSPGAQAISNPTLGKQLVPPRLAFPLGLPGAAIM